MIGTRIGGWLVEGEIGYGGMGTVYRASGPDGVVALKIAHPHVAIEPRHVARFVREAEAGRSMRHPNVVSVLADGVFEGRPWIAMELVEGQTLRSLLAELARLPEELCRHLGIEILRGLRAIHDAGVVHRDLKPDNVLVTPSHAVRIMDLGLADRADGRDLTDTGAFVGTAAYAAPEQFGGAARFDGRTDLHAVGVVLYELACGTHPFRGDDFRSTVNRILHEPPRALGDVNPQVSPFFEEFVHRLLSKDPAGRFATAAEALDVLTRGESAEWWTDRTREIRLATHRPPRAIRVPRETAMYGRDADLLRLSDAWASARGGAGRVVLVEGEPGIGKSRLAEEFTGRLAREGVAVLWGSWPPGGAATGNSAFAEAIRSRFGATSLEPELAALLPERAALVAPFAALLSGGAPSDGAGTALSREAVQTLVVDTIRALAAAGPLVVVADDLDAAPDEGRALFAAVANAIPSHAVLLIGTFAPGSADAWAADLSRLEHVSRVTLGRLGARELIRLLSDALRSGPLAEELAGRIALKSDGNPFFVFEILRTLRESRLLARRADGSWATTQVLREIRIPDTVRDLVEARLAELSDDDLELVRVAACQGFSFDPMLVGAVVGLPALPLLKRLGAIEIRHRLVRSAGRRYEFDHHQVQEILAAGLSDLHREAYHAALGEALEARHGGASADPSAVDGAVCAELAEHFLRGGRPDCAARWMDRALSHLDRQHAHAAFVSVVDLALAVSGCGGAERARLLLRKTKPLDRLGRRDDHRAALAEALRLADASADPRLRVRVRVALGQFAFAGGTSSDDDRAGVAEAAALAREHGDVEGECDAEGLLGSLWFNSGRPLEGRPHWTRSRDLARSAGLRAAEARAEGSLGHALVLEGRHDEACEAFDRARRGAHEVGDAHAEAVAIGNLGMARCEMGRFDDAIDLYRVQIARMRELGSRRHEAVGIGNLANVLYLLGRLAEAVPLYERQITLARETGDRLGEAIALVNIGQLRRVLGDDVPAREALFASAGAAESLGARHPLGFAQNALGQLFAQSGEAGEAYRWFQAALTTRRSAGYQAGIATTLSDLGDHLSGIGRRDEGAAALREARDVAHVHGLGGIEATVLCRLAALGEVPADEAARALAAAERGLSRCEVIDCRWRLHTATGDRSHLDVACGLLEGMIALAPPESRARMAESVPLHRAVLAARGGGPGAPEGTT